MAAQRGREISSISPPGWYAGQLPDAWLNWPARISAQMAAKLGVDPHTMHIALEAAVREHLQELGEMRPRVD